jgi:hypothetical protein
LVRIIHIQKKNVNAITSGHQGNPNKQTLTKFHCHALCYSDGRPTAQWAVCITASTKHPLISRLPILIIILPFLQLIHMIKKKKGKAIPVTGCGGP